METLFAQLLPHPEAKSDARWIDQLLTQSKKILGRLFVVLSSFAGCAAFFSTWSQRLNGGLNVALISLGSLLMVRVQYFCADIAQVYLDDVLKKPNCKYLSGLDPLLPVLKKGICFAIGMGAQKLTADLVSGFFILLEGVYFVGHYVKVGDREGAELDAESEDILSPVKVGGISKYENGMANLTVKAA